MQSRAAQINRLTDETCYLQAVNMELRRRVRLYLLCFYNNNNNKNVRFNVA